MVDYDETVNRRRKRNPDDQVALDLLDDAEEVVEPAEPEEEELNPDAMDADAVSAYIDYRITDAEDFMESEIIPRFNQVQAYYNGAINLEAEDGRSSVVINKTRDTIRALRPSIMRAMLQSSSIVEFQPRTDEDVTFARAATDVVNTLWQQLDGYGLLGDAIDDALLKGVAAVRVWWEEIEEVSTTTYETQTPEQIAAFEEDDEVSSVEVDDEEDVVTVQRRVIRSRPAMRLLRPETLLIDRNATCVEDTLIIGYREEMDVSDLVEMGFDKEQVQHLSVDDYDKQNAQATRQLYHKEQRSGEGDPSSKEITVSTVWLRMDADGDGVAEWREIIAAGASNEILSNEPAKASEIHFMYAERNPHTVFPLSIGELMMDDTDAMSSMIRAMVDNAHAVNNPRLAINENLVNLEDAQNGELGAHIRVKQSGHIQVIEIQPSGTNTLPLLNWLDDEAKRKGGVSNSEFGLHPDALQSTTAAAVQATIGASQAQTEMITRNIAFGLGNILMAFLKVLIQNADSAFISRVNEQFVQVDPRAWHAELDVCVNVGLGTGQPDQKMALLRETALVQKEMLQLFGESELMSFQNLRNTFVEMLELAGIHDTARYFPPVTESALRVLQRNKPGQDGQQGDMSNVLIAGEQIKAQTDMAQAQIDAGVDMAKARMDDDRERDKQAQEFALDEARLFAETGIQLDKNRLDAEVNRDRYTNGQGESPAGG